MDLYFTEAKVRSFLYFSLIVLLTLVTLYYIPDHATSWLLFTAMLFALTPNSPVQPLFITLLLLPGMGLASIAAMIVTSWVGHAPVLFAIYLALLGGGSVLIKEYYPLLRWPALMVVIFGIIAIGAQPYMDVLLASLIVLCVQVIFSIGASQHEYRFYCYKMLSELKEMSRDVFECFLDPDYSHNVYLFERRVHRRKMQYLQLASSLRKMLKKQVDKADTAEVQKCMGFCDVLFQHLQDLSILRWRVTDYTAFSLCTQELKGIAGEIDICLDTVWLNLMGSEKQGATTALNYWIKRIDDNYHNVLQVASREPLVFALFVDSLSAMSKTIDEYD